MISGSAYLLRARLLSVIRCLLYTQFAPPATIHRKDRLPDKCQPFISTQKAPSREDAFGLYDFNILRTADIFDKSLRRERPLWL